MKTTIQLFVSVQYYRIFRQSFCILSCVSVILLATQFAFAQSPYSLSAASFLGDGGNTDRVRGARILSDGTIVLAANIGASSPGGIAPILLNGATAASSGAIVRLSADGRTVLSVTRLAAQVEDVSIDANDNIYVAAWNGGAIKLNSAASTLLWAKPGRTLRIDAGGAGYVAALVTTTTNPDAGDPGAGTISVYDSVGTQIGNFPGKNNTLDVCLDAVSQTVITIGWRQATAFDGNSNQPVQISYLRGSAYDGAVKYTGYDWSTDPDSPRFINRPQNNMADTRGYRCAIGGDGKLYAAFEAAGGNHIFRYSPLDIVTPVGIVGGDRWHVFYNTQSQHKTFFARYEPATGAYLLGQQLLTRLSNNTGNTMRVNTGAIAADAAGRVYIGGASAWGLPLPPHPFFMVRPGETTFNPFPSGYLGGSWFIVMSADFTTRLYATRLTTGGGTHAIDAHSAGAGAARIVFGGTTNSPTETYVYNALQPTIGGGTQDGWFGVIGGAASSSPFDFDGDGKADISVFRQSTGTWYLNRSSAGFAATNFGLSSDKLTPADYDGDGKTDLAVFRDGAWYILNSSNNSVRVVNFGQSGDVSVPADYDADGKADAAVFRQGIWYFLNSSNNQVRVVQFGVSSDKAVPADFDGDARTDVAVFREGVWYHLRSSDNGFRVAQFGAAGDRPVVGDYDGDGRADYAAFRAGVWYLNRSTAGFSAVQFGVATDIPAPADYDGDKRTDIAVFRNGAWYLLQSTQGFTAAQFGAPADKPVPSIFIP